MRLPFPILVFVVCSSVAAAQPDTGIKILFDISSQDTATQQAAIRHMTGIAVSHPEIPLQLVVYGPALPMVLDNLSLTEADLRKLTSNNRITIKACAITMRKYGIPPDKLIPGVEVVPDAIVEIATRQHQGWSYIKESY